MLRIQVRLRKLLVYSIMVPEEDADSRLKNQMTNLIKMGAKEEDVKGYIISRVQLQQLGCDGILKK